MEFEFLEKLIDAKDDCQDENIFDQFMKMRFDIIQRFMLSVAENSEIDPRGFLTETYESSFAEGRAWMKETDTADVMRL